MTRHPRAFQFRFVADITGNITLYLLFPELDIGLWQTEILATLMTMPKATVDENDSLVFWQNNIRGSRQFSDLNTETQTTREKILPHNHLRLRILPLNRSHIPTPLFSRFYVSHYIRF